MLQEVAEHRSRPPPRKGLLLRLDPGMHKRLRLLAVEEDTTVQQLGVEALEMLFRSRARATK